MNVNNQCLRETYIALVDFCEMNKLYLLCSKIYLKSNWINDMSHVMNKHSLHVCNCKNVCLINFSEFHQTKGLKVLQFDLNYSFISPPYFLKLSVLTRGKHKGKLNICNFKKYIVEYFEFKIQQPDIFLKTGRPYSDFIIQKKNLNFLNSRIQRWTNQKLRYQARGEGELYKCQRSSLRTCQWLNASGKGMGPKSSKFCPRS